VRWSVIPGDLRTLELLVQKFPAGTVIYPLLSESDRESLGAMKLAEIESAGWRVAGKATLPHGDVVVLRPYRHSP
jgi:hypothetical protein